MVAVEEVDMAVELIRKKWEELVPAGAGFLGGCRTEGRSFIKLEALERGQLWSVWWLVFSGSGPVLRSHHAPFGRW
jgi:hypothetical protein